jgi:hypothetical protein
MVESLIVMLATCLSSTPNLSGLSAGAGENGVSVCPPYFQIPATWLVWCPTCPELLSHQSPALTPVCLGPIIDMDNRRRNDDDARKRQRDKELREQAQREREFREWSRIYGPAYPPYTGTYAPQGYYYNPRTGYYYPYPYPNNGSLSTRNGGQYHQPYGYYYPDTKGYDYPNNGSAGSRTKNAGGTRDGRR